MKHDALKGVGLGVAPVASFDPVCDLGVLVSGLVVDDQMQRKAVGRLLVDLLKEGEPLAVGVACRSAPHDLAVEIVQRREKRERAVPDVVVGGGLDVADAQG